MSKSVLRSAGNAVLHTPLRDRSTLRRSPGKVAFLAVALTCGLTPGCGAPPMDPEAASEPAHDVAERRDGLTASAAERIIPVRFVNLGYTAGEALPAHIDESLALANYAFRSTGAQFYAREVKSYAMPSFVYPDASTTMCWNDPSGTCPASSCKPGTNAYAELSQVFTMSNTEFPACRGELNSNWLTIAAVKWAPYDAVHVWVGNEQSSGGPDTRRDVKIGWPALNDGDANFAHELGHYLGLPHVNVLPVDPETLAPLTMADMWDLVYLPGSSTTNPHRFYSTKPSSSTGLAFIEPCVQTPCNPNCLVDVGTKVTTCTLPGQPGPFGSAYSETFSSTDPRQLENKLLFTNSTYGTNVMSYASLTLASLTTPANLPGITETQSMLVRRVLRFDRALTVDKPVVGVTGRGGRPLLGAAQVGAPLSSFDMNGDTKRDIAMWYPATNTFKVAFSSSTGFSAPSLTLTVGSGLNLAFGVPFAGDLNGDGRADLGVYLPTNNTWYWCPTAATPANTTCASPSTIVLGTPTSKPMGVHKMDGTSSQYVVTFDSNGTWSWKNAVGGGGTRTLPGGVAAWGTAQAFGSLQDADDQADLVAYQPELAKFTTLRSSGGWTSPGAVRTFPSSYIPLASGTAAQRAGAVMVPGLSYRGPWGAVRQGFGLWDPETGAWEAVYDQFGAYGAPQTLSGCVYGTPGDVPMGGLGLGGATANYRFANLSVYRSGPLSSYPLNPGEGYILRDLVTDRAASNAGPLGCAYNYTYNSVGTASARQPVFDVADLTGDGLADVIKIDGDTAGTTLVEIHGSPAFGLSQTIDFGSAPGEFLLDTFRRALPVDAVMPPRSPAPEGAGL